MNLQEWWAFLLLPSTPPIVPIATALAGGVGGFLVSRFTLNANDREVNNHKKREMGVNHQQERDKRFQAFTNAMQAYIIKESSFDLNDFQSISTTGSMYFSELRSIADSILAGRIDEVSRDRSFVPDLVEAINKNIPLYYDNLHAIADNIGVPYDGKFDRRYYDSIFEVVEKYARAELMPPAANTPPKRATRDD